MTFNHLNPFQFDKTEDLGIFMMFLMPMDNHHMNFLRVKEDHIVSVLRRLVLTVCLIIRARSMTIWSSSYCLATSVCSPACILWLLC